ncbi:MAG: tryptophan synthase subunit alpha [Alphaproteobacteria bacterium]|nr:tryptophan synthase subunit alpha [Alphaproteobacteria bacterium]
MNRIEKTFKSLNRPALITFITAGDTDYETSMNVLKSLPDAGADIIELGMPFTDPVADGPVIQLASQRALKNGANMHKTLQMVTEFRKNNANTPIILMGYANPVFAYGMKAFTKDAGLAGVDGLIIVDMPPEESKELQNLSQTHGLSIIRLITPTTDEKRLPKVLKGANGFLYYVSITGITGAASANLTKLKPHIEQIRKSTDLPIVIGFGIKTPEDVAKIAKIGDGIVVGSSIIQTIEKKIKNADPAPVIAQVKLLAKAL